MLFRVLPLFAEPETVLVVHHEVLPEVCSQPATQKTQSLLAHELCELLVQLGVELFGWRDGKLVLEGFEEGALGASGGGVLVFHGNLLFGIDYKNEMKAR